MVTYLEDSDAFEYWDSAEWTSLAPAAPSGNAIINGAFEINQRAFSSSTASGNYNFDRWRQDNLGGTVTTSAQAFTLGAAPVSGYESANFLRTVVAGQVTDTHFAVAQQQIEGVRAFAGQTVTISFFAKAASGTPKIGVAMTQSFGTGGSPSAALNTGVGAVTLSTSWASYSLTYNVPSISGKTLGTNGNDYLGVELWVSAGSTLSARTSNIGLQNNTFDIWGIQVEAGSVANPFRRNANSIQGELAACQRYYFRTTDVSSGRLYNLGLANTSTSAIFPTIFPVQMRIAPAALEQSGTAGDYSVRAHTSNNITCTAVPTFFASNRVQGIATFTVASGLTAGHAAYQRASNADGFLGWSAEL
jgi:hypothetical protein